MALQTVNITLGQSLGGGNYSSTVAGGTIADATTILTDITAALDACTTALGHAGGSFDSTTDITAIQSAVTTVQTDATGLTGAVSGGNVSITWDDAVVTSRNALRAGLLAALQAVNEGYGGLSE